jgi:hypothetical protein
MGNLELGSKEVEPEQSHQAPALSKSLEQWSDACSTNNHLYAVIDSGVLQYNT